VLCVIGDSGLLVHGACLVLVLGALRSPGQPRILIFPLGTRVPPCPRLGLAAENLLKRPRAAGRWPLAAGRRPPGLTPWRAMGYMGTEEHRGA
jgi:hypothetical protein